MHLTTARLLLVRITPAPARRITLGERLVPAARSISQRDGSAIDRAGLQRNAGTGAGPELGDGDGSATWHGEYPFADELDPLRMLAHQSVPDPVFTMYQIVRRSDGLAIGGLGFFGPPDERRRVEFGYGLVEAARGEGLATEAVLAALELAREHGATVAEAETDLGNSASQRVLAKAGLVEVQRGDQTITYRRSL